MKKKGKMTKQTARTEINESVLRDIFTPRFFEEDMREEFIKEAVKMAVRVFIFWHVLPYLIRLAGFITENIECIR